MQTLAVDAPAEQAVTAITVAGLSAIAPGVFAGTASHDDTDASAVVAIQPASAGKSQLHVSVEHPAADTEIPMLRLALSAWAMRLRDMIETGAEKESEA